MAENEESSFPREKKGMKSLKRTKIILIYLFTYLIINFWRFKKNVLVILLIRKAKAVTRCYVCHNNKKVYSKPRTVGALENRFVLGQLYYF